MIALHHCLMYLRSFIWSWLAPLYGKSGQKGQVRAGNVAAMPEIVASFDDDPAQWAKQRLDMVLMIQRNRRRPKVFHCAVCGVESYELWIDGVCGECANTPEGRAVMDGWKINGAPRSDKAPPQPLQ
jgi:hypothetical protein